MPLVFNYIYMHRKSYFLAEFRPSNRLQPQQLLNHLHPPSCFWSSRRKPLVKNENTRSWHEAYKARWTYPLYYHFIIIACSKTWLCIIAVDLQQTDRRDGWGTRSTEKVHDGCRWFRRLQRYPISLFGVFIAFFVLIISSCRCSHFSDWAIQTYWCDNQPFPFACRLQNAWI